MNVDAENKPLPLPPTCITCKHLLGNRNNVQDAAEKWRCYHPANIVANNRDIVTGQLTVKYRHERIYDVRNSLLGTCGACGAEGRLWELYEPPSRIPYTPPASAAASSQSARISKLRKSVSLEDI